LRAIKVT